MHSNDYDIEGEHFTIHHNGDYSGDVFIVLHRASRIEHNDGSEDYGIPAYDTIELPFELLRKLVLDYVRREAISEIEKANYDELELMVKEIASPVGSVIIKGEYFTDLTQYDERGQIVERFVPVHDDWNEGKSTHIHN